MVKTINITANQIRNKTCLLAHICIIRSQIVIAFLFTNRSRIIMDSPIITRRAVKGLLYSEHPIA